MSETRMTATETAWIRERALTLGFNECGVAPAEKFPELEYFTEWLERGYAGEMKYLEDSRRQDPREAMPQARSLIVCLLNYNAAEPYSTEAERAARNKERPRGWISRYAWGHDYHEVLWGKLNQLVSEIKAHFAGTFEVRAYADTGPVHERAAAKYAGLGWLAKNTLLIHPRLGSWLFLGVIVTSLRLTPSLAASEAPLPDLCGTCRRCLDACPTQAIVEPYVLDASRCIAYLTIELRGPIPEQYRDAMGWQVFGCDICQDVCPWNRKSPRTQAKEFQPRKFTDTKNQTWDEIRDPLFSPDLLKLANLSIEEFRATFRGSAMKRAKWQGLVRNACIAIGNSRYERGSQSHREALSTLERLARSSDAGISESARWALSRIEQTVDQSEPSEPKTGELSG